MKFIKRGTQKQKQVFKKPKFVFYPEVAELFSDWENCVNLTSPLQKAYRTGNFGQMQQINLKVLKTDSKIRKVFYGTMIPLDTSFTKK